MSTIWTPRMVAMKDESIQHNDEYIGSRWFIAIIGEIYSLVWIETSHLHFSVAEQISLYYKQKNKKTIWFCKMLFLLLVLPNNFTK